jgi:hypothetical protein
MFLAASKKSRQGRGQVVGYLHESENTKKFSVLQKLQIRLKSDICSIKGYTQIV